jgi:hypothetical protein
MAKGLCSKCYYRIKRGGTPEVSKKQQMALRKCSIADCNEPHFSNNYCDMHLRRFKRHGDPLFINPKCNRDGNYTKRARLKTAQWKKNNKKYYNAYLAQQKDRLKLATTKWANLEAIKLFYYNRPKGYHIDHIIPLNGHIISGLHVLENLRYLPAKENLSKSNKY